MRADPAGFGLFFLLPVKAYYKEYPDLSAFTILLCFWGSEQPTHPHH